MLYASWLPIVTFLLGWGSGVITAWAMYRDHDRRLSNVEAVTATVATAGAKNTQDVAVLFQQIRDIRHK